MKRRDFVKGMAMAGAASGFTGAAAGSTGAAAQGLGDRATGHSTARSGAPLAQDDIVVDGLFAGAI
ncbi:MAG: hypothetical protein OXH51_14950, partial [Gemmatimonadetes bacterium]|nr:hypothetical protein [Gemmatimonadota bacterium]